MPEPPSKPLAERTPADLNALADRCAERAKTGFVVHPNDVEVYVAALRALAAQKGRR